MRTIDGFKKKNSIDFLPTTPDPTLNPWSYGEITMVDIYYDDYWLNLKDGRYRATITWKGQTDKLVDINLFRLIIKSWMNDKWNPMSKEAAFDLWFEMRAYVPA